MTIQSLSYYIESILQYASASDQALATPTLCNKALYLSHPTTNCSVLLVILHNDIEYIQIFTLGPPSLFQVGPNWVLNPVATVDVIASSSCGNARTRMRKRS